MIVKIILTKKYPFHLPEGFRLKVQKSSFNFKSYTVSFKDLELGLVEGSELNSIKEVQIINKISETEYEALAIKN